MKKLRITVEGKSYEVTVETLEDSGIQMVVPRASGVTSVSSASVVPMARAAVAAPVAAASASASGAGAMEVLSPMSGNVFKVEVQAGAQVNKGDKLIILEAMKMETPIFAAGSGKIEAVLVKPGDNVVEGQLLVKIA